MDSHVIRALRTLTAPLGWSAKAEARREDELEIDLPPTHVHLHLGEARIGVQERVQLVREALGEQDGQREDRLDVPTVGQQSPPGG